MTGIGTRLRKPGKIRAALATVSVCAALLGAPTAPAFANGWSVAKTAYFAPTDTYYQLVKTKTNWQDSAALAGKLKHQGRAGRLAVVDNRDLHEWLISSFRFNQRPYTSIIWIGLRYWCPARMLAWVDNEPVARGAFAPWHPQWHRSSVVCGRARIDFMGVYYEGEKTNLWQAAGQAKLGDHALVEFPPE